MTKSQKCGKDKDWTKGYANQKGKKSYWLFFPKSKKTTHRSLKHMFFLCVVLLGKVINEKEWDYEAHWV